MGKNLIKTTVYSCAESANRLFLSKGDLRDWVRRDRLCEPREHFVPDHLINVETIWHLAPPNFDKGNIIIYRGCYEDSDNFKHGDWYFHLHDAVEEIRGQHPEVKEDDITYSMGVLMAPRNKPVTFPRTEILEPIESRDADNRDPMGIRLNPNPMEYGSFGRTKIFFPDRSCKGLCQGPIEVTEIVDKGRYGFFKGKMKTFEFPAEEKLAEWLIEHTYCDVDVRDYGKLRFYQSNTFGNFVVFDRFSRTFITGDKNGDVHVEETLKCVREETLQGNYEEVSVNDFLCQGYQGCSFREFKDVFHEVPEAMRRRIACQGYNEGYKYISDEFDDALEDGCITLYSFGNATVACLRNAMKLAINFSEDEVKGIAETFNKINAEAEVHIKSLAKKGKL